ncbi:MAG: T9SS type A sorting domain-containing protein [Candidatus Poribacteria bacterium]|nr:T9SS type A sorting domain-containing protein [Candidatus Poribacteria bacterium]
MKRLTTTHKYFTFIFISLLLIVPIQISPAIEEISIPNIMLRVVYVTTEWMPFSDPGGWTAAVPIKESEVLKYYEVAIWEETSSVHLYAFPNDYHSWNLFDKTDEQKIAHREQYMILKYTDLPPDVPGIREDQRSLYLKAIFMHIAAYLVNQHPTAEHHLVYNGHGAPGGDLFELQLHRNDANKFLNFWTQSLGKRLGVIDMGGPCNKAGFGDLANFCEYARYYVASDQPNGGYAMDDFTAEKDDEVDPDLQYHNLFASKQGLRNVLIGRSNIMRKGYEYSINYMTNHSVSQANYIFSCSAFRDFFPIFLRFLNNTGNYNAHGDLYQYMIDNNAPQTLIRKFKNVIVYNVDNRDFFQWQNNNNGISLPHPQHVPKLNKLASLNRPVSVSANFQALAGKVEVQSPQSANRLKKIAGPYTKKPESQPLPEYLKTTGVVNTASSDYPPIYWVDTSKSTLHRLIGTNIENIVPSAVRVIDLDLDSKNEKMYWIEQTGNHTSNLKRANLDGTNVELIKNLNSLPQSIALDPTNHKIYITTYQGNMQRINTDGSNFQPNLITRIKNPKGLAIDTSNGKIYWIQETATVQERAHIQSANLDGSNIKEIVTVGGYPRNLAVHNNIVYWVDHARAIKSVPLNNTVKIEVLSRISEGHAFDIAVDPTSRKLYWTTSLGTMERSNLDGSNREINLITGLGIADNFALNTQKRRTTETIVETPEVPAETPVETPSAIIEVTQPSELTMDVNEEGSVDHIDLIIIIDNLGETGLNAADVNKDGIVDVIDIVLVATAMFDNTANAPSLHPQLFSMVTARDVQKWLFAAQSLGLTDITYQKGIQFLEELLITLVPKQTILLPNYPNPFNPETWIPYQLAQPTQVTITIYGTDGKIVRQLNIGHQTAGTYQSKSRAAYWNGKNETGEPVASGVYFYTFTAGAFTVTRKMLIQK